MRNFLNSLSSDNLVMICIVMGVIALILAIVISIEIRNSNKKYKKLLEEERFGDDDNSLNITYDENITYVDEDSELEKTKAKMELDTLRNKFKEEELLKRKNLEKNIELALANETERRNLYKSHARNNRELLVNEEQNTEVKNEDTANNTIQEKNKTLNEEKSNNNNNINIRNEVNIETKENEEERKQIEKIEEEKKKIEQELKQKEIEEKEKKKQLEEKLDQTLTHIDIPKMSKENNTKTQITIENNINDDYEYEKDDDEDTAIISYDELVNAQHLAYTDEEMANYVDEKDAIISIKELENLYFESQKIEVDNNINEEKKEETSKKNIQKDFQNSYQKSDFISPVYGIRKTEEDIKIEQTANYEKLNDEIKKTNEFLKALKDLKKNLE